jgi:ElaB/YqjD/DUF883 family membrane-anchored ribosome-binding protein
MPNTQDLKAQAHDAKQRVADLAHDAQRVAGERFGMVRDSARTYADGAVDQFGNARTYAVDRIQDKPVTAVLAVLGVGVVLGVLLGLSAQRHYD